MPTAKKYWPAAKVAIVPISELVPYAQNSRTHSQAQVAQIADSMLEFGWTNPVLRDEDSTIIAGHGRILAAQLNIERGHPEFKDAPVMSAVGWTESQKRAYVIADNKLAENAGWDEEILRTQMALLKDADFDIGLVGFTAAEMAALLKPKGGGLTDPDEVVDPLADAVSKSGDIWQLGAHRIMCGSSVDKEAVAALLDGVVPHLMVTDPPYGVRYDPNWRGKATGGKVAATGVVLNDDRADWREAWELFPGAVAYVWHGALHSATVQLSLEAAGFMMRSHLIWAKDRLILSRGHYHWKHEPCWYAVRKGETGHWHGGRKQTTLLSVEVNGEQANEDVLRIVEAQGVEQSVWEIPVTVDDGSTGHGTQKPVECMARPMRNNSLPGEFVYEPFSGSGSTIIAGEMEGRRVLAMELSPVYVDVAVRRWQRFTGRLAFRLGDGVSFDSLANDSPEDPDHAAWA